MYVGHRTLNIVGIVRWTLCGGHRMLDIVQWTLYVGHRAVDNVCWTSYVGHFMVATCAEQSGANHVPNVSNFPHVPSTDIVPGQPRSTRSRLLPQPLQTGSNALAKSAAVAASRHQAAGGWSSPWSAATLASISLVEGQAASVSYTHLRAHETLR